MTADALTEHPDITDAWSAFVPAAELIYDGFTGDWAGAWKEANDLWNKVNNLTNQHFGVTGSFAVTEAVSIPDPFGGISLLDYGDEVRVWFRGFSEDDLQGNGSSVAVAPGATVAKIEENSSSANDQHFYDVVYSVPITGQSPTGHYIFNFTSGDDGWFFDVGVAAVLDLLVKPPPMVGPPRISVDPALFVAPAVKVKAIASPDATAHQLQQRATMTVAGMQNVAPPRVLDLKRPRPISKHVGPNIVNRNPSG